MQHNEDNEQAALFRWMAFERGAHPEIDMLYHIPNGGRRDSREAARLKRQGVRAGVPDLCLPVPRGGYGALYIELKVKGGRLSENQKAWMERLRRCGNKAVVCFGWEEAAGAIREYLGIM